MGIGISIFFIAVGAVLTWGVTDTTPGIDVAAVGVILMLVGLVGLALTLAFWSSFSPFPHGSPFRRNYASGPGYYDDDVVVEHRPRRQRRVVLHDEPTTVIRDERTSRRGTVVIEELDDPLT
ncbi:MAG: DUF6458 family protein [Dehalococcoidia bacterium]